MPRRMFDPSLFESDKINELTDFQYRLWSALILRADNAGRCDARAKSIKGLCFAMIDRITVSMIEDGISHLEAVGCVVRYYVKGVPYLYFPNWGKHQRLRNTAPKYPAPDGDARQAAAIGGELRQNAAACQNCVSEEEVEEEGEGEEAPYQKKHLHESIAEQIPMTQNSWDQLIDFEGYLPLELIEYAYNETVEHGAKAWSYMRKVLAKLADRGVQTVEEAEKGMEEEVKPLWTKEDEKKECLTPEQLAELNAPFLKKLRMG